MDVQIIYSVEPLLKGGFSIVTEKADSLRHVCLRPGEVLAFEYEADANAMASALNLGYQAWQELNTPPNPD